MKSRLFALKKKLLNALAYKGYILDIESQAIFLPKLGRTCNKYYLVVFVPTDIYNNLVPNEPYKSTYRPYRKVEVCSMWREIDIIKELVRWQKGESDNMRRIFGIVPPKARSWEEAQAMTGLGNAQLTIQCRQAMREAEAKKEQALEEWTKAKKRKRERMINNEWRDTLRPNNW